jgi:hypothetical protein
MKSYEVHDIGIADEFPSIGGHTKWPLVQVQQRRGGIQHYVRIRILIREGEKPALASENLVGSIASLRPSCKAIDPRAAKVVFHVTSSPQ